MDYLAAEQYRGRQGSCGDWRDALERRGVMAVSKRLKFEILRRDGFVCRYCKASDVKLTVDHVIPETLGGTDEPSNLVAACSDCNNGKSSSHPDAPLVTEVSDTALRWAAAMKTAQAQMLADLEARERNREQFRQWWNNWTYEDGGERRSLTPEADWEHTVDQLTAAGLPLPVLKECIDGAMRRKKVPNDGKFRYMCGIAWSKVGELQKAAQSATSGTSPITTPAADPGLSLDRGRLELARELLDELSSEERAYYLKESDMSPWQDEDDEPQTEAQMACEAIGYALNSARSNLAWLTGRVRGVLEDLPGDVGAKCLAEAEDRASRIQDPNSRMAAGMSTALYALVELMDLESSTAYMNELPDEERSEWVRFAKNLDEHASISEERWLVRAAKCARAIASGLYYPVMCTAPGAHIPDCPERGTHHAVIAELKCCEELSREEHEGHLVCEKHLKRLTDGTYVGRGGRTLTALSFSEAPKAVAF